MRKIMKVENVERYNHTGGKINKNKLREDML